MCGLVQVEAARRQEEEEKWAGVPEWKRNLMLEKKKKSDFVSTCFTCFCLLMYSSHNARVL